MTHCWKSHALAQMVTAIWRNWELVCLGMKTIISSDGKCSKRVFVHLILFSSFIVAILMSQNSSSARCLFTSHVKAILMSQHFKSGKNSDSFLISH